MQKKKQFTIRMPTDLYEQMQRSLSAETGRSPSPFITNAVRLYLGHLSATQGEDYLSKTMLSVIHAGQDRIKRSLCSVLYAVAVEMNIIQRILVSHFDVPESLYAEMRRDAHAKVSLNRKQMQVEKLQQELFGGDDTSQS